MKEYILSLFEYKVYKFRYFSSIHKQSFWFCFILCLILFLMPYLIKGLEKGKYTTFLGYFCIFAKILDSFYRIIFEKYPWYDTVPLNLCNVSLIIGGIYFITRKRIYFNLLYFYFSGAILAVILPGVIEYYTIPYMHVFMLTHTLEIFAVIYGFVHLDERITTKGLIVSLIIYILLIGISFIWNEVYGTNFMFIHDYIISAINFIKPFWLYRVIFISLFMLSIVLMYMPFMYSQKEPLEMLEI